MLTRLLGSVVAITLLWGASAFAQDACDPLKPNPPRNLSQEVVGKIDAKVSGLAGRILNAGGNVEGSYRDISADVLREYPNADKLFLWERTIYIFCITISKSRLSDSEKFDRIERLMDRVNKGPPSDKQGSLDLNEFRIGETALPYIVSLLGTPRREARREIHFSKLGYDFILEFATDDADSVPKGMLRAFFVTRTPDYVGTPGTLIFNGAWNTTVARPNIVNLSDASADREIESKKPDLQIINKSSALDAPLREFSAADCNSFKGVRSDDDSSALNEIICMIGYGTFSIRISIAIEDDWVDEDLFDLYELYHERKFKEANELRKEIEKRSDYSKSDLSDTNIREELQARLINCKVSGLEVRRTNIYSIYYPGVRRDLR